ncbi:MAG: SpoIIE family protein phosphatase [Lentisphaeria bacterium]|nr:SpoIIE family protein phosphatase [Lentisphaeria bacterium]
MLAIEQNDMETTLPDPKDHRVLLVSCNELITFTLHNYFTDSDITIHSVSGKTDAIKNLKQYRFVSVIIDICQDLEKGLELRRAVRDLDARIPILFLTPLVYWSDVRLLDQIVEDPNSYYVPENADRNFILSKLTQAIGAYQADNSLNLLKAKIARNLFLAGLLQRAMLPPWVYFSDHYEFSCLYRPFTQVSGDLFEWLPLDEGRALFIFGDVSGHGTHSALAMTAIQSFLTQVVMLDKERATHPELMAADINNFFCQHLHNIVYMSTLIAYIDFKQNYIRYQNAGCMDFFCVDAETGEILNINPERKGSIPPGLVKDTVYTEKDNVEYHFSDSTVFLMSSDGLMDLAKDKAGSKGMDMEMCKRLSSILTKDAQKENKSIALPFRCLHSLEQFGYGCPQDDMSMAMIRKPRLSEKLYVFSCRVPTDKKAVDEICQKASVFVTDHYHDENLSVGTELLLEEYLVNIIMHGLNEYEKLNEYIAVELCAYPEELKLIIWDRGKEWNGLFMTPERAEESMDQLNETMSASGRGIPIISKIASQISRQRYCGLNETIFIIPRQGRDHDKESQ